MQLEFHQLECRWEHLRVRHPARQRRLLASLADCGQQAPIVVVAAESQPDRYMVIDGYKRIVVSQLRLLVIFAGSLRPFSRWRRRISW
jgi:hypothetical protein